MEWNNVKDKLPPSGEVVLIYIREYSDFSKCEMDSFHIATYWEDEPIGWFCPYENGRQVNPTFWIKIEGPK